jgi:hypothetical protein
MIHDDPSDPEKDFENTLRYGPGLEFDVFPITTMEDAFPVILSVYGWGQFARAHWAGHQRDVACAEHDRGAHSPPRAGGTLPPSPRPTPSCFPSVPLVRAKGLRTLPADLR